MVRSIWLLAAVALAAGLSAAAPAANAQQDGAVQTTGPLGAAPHKAKPRQTGIKKRAASVPLRKEGRSRCTPGRPA